MVFGFTLNASSLSEPDAFLLTHTWLVLLIASSRNISTVFPWTQDNKKAFSANVSKDSDNCFLHRQWEKQVMVTARALIHISEMYLDTVFNWNAPARVFDPQCAGMKTQFPLTQVNPCRLSSLLGGPQLCPSRKGNVQFPGQTCGHRLRLTLQSTACSQTAADARTGESRALGIPLCLLQHAVLGLSTCSLSITDVEKGSSNIAA